MLQLESYPVLPAATRVETQVPFCNQRGTLSSPSQLERRPDSPAETREETQVPHFNTRKDLTPLLQLEMNPDFSHHNSRGILHFLLKLERNSELPNSTGEEAQFPCCYWRGTQTSPLHIKMSPKH